MGLNNTESHRQQIFPVVFKLLIDLVDTGTHLSNLLNSGNMYVPKAEGRKAELITMAACYFMFMPWERAVTQLIV